MKESVKRRMASYRKDVNKRCLKKMDDDLQKIVTPSDISKFSTSQIGRDALKVLAAASQGQDTSISRNEYTVVHDYLMSDPILKNANRPGVLAKMQVKDVKEARLIEDHYIVSISSHKTSGVRTRTSQDHCDKKDYNAMRKFVRDRISLINSQLESSSSMWNLFNGIMQKAIEKFVRRKSTGYIHFGPWSFRSFFFVDPTDRGPK